MSKIVLVSKNISSDFSQSLSNALRVRTGGNPTIVSIDNCSTVKKFIPDFAQPCFIIINKFLNKFKNTPNLQIEHFDVVHFSSLECLLNFSLDFFPEDGPIIMVDVSDIGYLFQRRRLRKGNSTLCPDTQFDAVRSLARADAYLCSNSTVYQGLIDFGINAKRMILDQTFISLEGNQPEKQEKINARAETLARAYNKDSLSYFWYERGLKWQIERENSILLMQDLIKKRTKWESRPAQIEFATNNRCNLQCIMCSPNGRPKGEELKEEAARSICDQVFPKASVLTPSAGSEPLLGNFELITQLCAKYSVQLNLITNGTLLTPDKYELMRETLGRLHISFDSHEKETYEKIRVGAKLATVSKNIREISKLAAEDNIEVMTSSVITRLNYRCIAEYVNYVAELGVNSVQLQELLINCPGFEELDLSKAVPNKVIEEEIDRAIEAAKIHEINLHVFLGEQRVFLFNKKKFRLFKPYYLNAPLVERFPKICRFVANYLKIEPDGSVFPCCFAPRELMMGNIKQDPFDSIWNGEKYQQLRNEMFTGNLRDCCRECPIV